MSANPAIRITLSQNAVSIDRIGGDATTPAPSASVLGLRTEPS
jgi:hypothetical protein